MWLFAVEAAFVGFIASLFALVWRGFDRDGAPRRAAPLWVVAAVLCFALLCVALPRVPRSDLAVTAEVAARQGSK